MSLEIRQHVVARRRVPLGAVDAMVATLAALLLLSMGLIVIRRAAGALVAPLPPLGLLGAGLLAAGGIGGLRWLVRREWLDRQPALRPWFEVVTTLVLASFALALWVPGTNPLGLLMLWAVVVAEEAFAWRFAGRSFAEPPSGGTNMGMSPSELEPEVTPPGDDVLQQLTRSRDDEGGQRLAGWLRLPLAAGQRSGALHVAFCPPLGAPPEVECSQADGPEARITPAAAFPHGVRLDVKLAEATDKATSILVWFEAYGAPPAD